MFSFFRLLKQLNARLEALEQKANSQSKELDLLRKDISSLSDGIQQFGIFKQSSNNNFELNKRNEEFWHSRFEMLERELNELKSYQSRTTLFFKEFSNIKQIAADINLIKEEREGWAWKVVDNVSLRTQRALSVALLHQKTFSPFKGLFKGKNVYLIATGNSVHKFVPPVGENNIFIGVNRAYQIRNIKFDILFAIDKISIESGYLDFFDYECLKFIGDQNLGDLYQIPENFLTRSDVKRYKTTANYLPEHDFPLNLESEALINSVSVAIQAMQFALYTNPDKIYLIGNDCNVAKLEHFYEETEDFSRKISHREGNLSLLQKNLIEAWIKIKKFQQTYYPHTEIVSVNPVLLKGIFEDSFIN